MDEARRTEVPVVDWARAGRRLRAWAIAIAGAVTAGVPITWMISGRPRLGEWVFGALVVLFAVELAVVGGSAARGMLRAGARGDRLARPDVSLLPARRRQVAVERSDKAVPADRPAERP